MSNEKWDQFGPAYDHEDYDQPPRIYLIASTARSGSHLLAHALMSTGQFGSPLEYFHPKHIARWKSELNAKADADMFRALFRRRTSKNSGWFGVKAHWPQFQSIVLDQKSAFPFQIEKYVHIQRRDIILQAISFVIAQQTRSWISFHGPSKAQPLYSRDEISNAILQIEREQECWRKYFAENKIAPVIIAYEDLTEEREKALTSILEAFDLPTSFAISKPGPLPEKQATSVNKQWKARYLEDDSQKEKPR